jgi:hypothetical protein
VAVAVSGGGIGKAGLPPSSLTNLYKCAAPRVDNLAKVLHKIEQSFGICVFAQIPKIYRKWAFFFVVQIKKQLEYTNKKL